ncbi:hypothetical protein C0Q70_01177 [Pomacea canaliculata]|uniref:DNA mismatch repair proteins mutS family domain-containing protein n=1 Tax=Pomacea canaliculata TaxID=400727 RepID=A0A2T7PYR7_POMCA|nr:hypothetical protein C0Q70_01177 [Pomacea canaliculata]
MNGPRQDQTAKYCFGLLETPESTNCTSSKNEDSSSSNSEQTPAVPSRLLASSNSLPDSSTLTSCSEAFGNTSAKKRVQTPVIRSSSSLASKTPGTFKTPRTVGVRKTPKTPYTSSSMTPAAENSCSVIVAIVEGRGLARGEIGMASLDLKSPVLMMSQFSDTQTYVKTMTKLQILKPLEIILPHTVCESGNSSKLFKMISDQFPNTNISSVQRRYFNETKAQQILSVMCCLNNVVPFRYYCLATNAALLKYVEYIQNIIFAPSSLKVVFKGSEHTTMIDIMTAKNLELLENRRDPFSNHSLFGVLKYTHTAGGARLLRSNILQPPSDLETITMRQDVVREFTEKEEVFYNLKGVLSKFLDVDHIISLCVQIPKNDNVKTAESKITTVICLKHLLELVPVLQEFLKDCENPLLKAYCKTLEDPRLQIVLSKINSVVHEDTKYQKGTLPMRTQNYSVYDIFSGLLDVARRAYTEIVDDITSMVTQLGIQFHLPLRTAFSTIRGFYIQLCCSGKETFHAEDLPPIFIKVTKFKTTLNFTTADLVLLFFPDRVKGSLDEIYLMTNIVMTELLGDVRHHITVLYKLSETVAMLDMLLAFAHACTLSSYEFTDTLAIKMGRHPILEKIGAGEIVPNNTYAAEDCNFVLITGPNMSGKSTYLKQVALLQIMAQTGSFVPAEYASFRIASQIFSRVGNDDDIQTNSSTFMLEMKEMNYIIQNVSGDSLVIIDELGRGTSAEEGVGICWSVCEYLLKTKAFTFFVTHYKELTSLDNLYANVENYFMEVHRSFSREGGCEKITYTHVMSQGKTPEEHYGLMLAEMSTMPKDVLHDAAELAEMLDRLRQKNQTTDPEVARHRAIFKLASKLLQVARNSRLDLASLRAYLLNLRLHSGLHPPTATPPLATTKTAELTEGL